MTLVRRLRVCMLSGYRPTPGGGGTEKHIFELARGLLDRNVDVDILCEDRSFLPDADNPLASHVIGIDSESLHEEDWVPQYLEKSRRFAAVLDPGRYDIVHCHSHYGYHTALRLARLIDRPALVTTYHLTPIGSLKRFEQLGFTLPPGAPIDRSVSIMEETMASLSDRCIAVSRGVAAEITEHYGVPEDRVRVIYNWYDPDIFFPRSRSSARRMLGLSPDATYLLYVGHFSDFRGAVLADTLKRLPDSVRLIAVHPEADEQIRAEFGDRVLFPGYQPPEQLAYYYAAADLQCFTPIYGAFGLVLVEGMACGLPPVVFDLPAMNEIVTPASGYLVPEPTAAAYGAAVLDALPSMALKREGAIERAGDFRMDGQIDRVLNLYGEALRRSPAPVVAGDPLLTVETVRGVAPRVPLEPARPRRLQGL